MRANRPQNRKSKAAPQPASRARKGTKPGAKAAATGRSTASSSSERLNRYLAHCGLCSRREADRWIAAGRVSINDKVVDQVGTGVKPGDRVAVDGKPVSVQTEHSYILYNKPKGQLCSRKDKRGRPLIYEHLDVAPNVQSIGRLDMDTEGLLLLTDDGSLARRLTHPGAKLQREYRARVAGQISLETLQKLRQGGMEIGDGDLSDPWEITVDSETGGHTWITVIITRGRWREVRRTLEAAGHPVRRLLRTRFGPIRLDEEMPHGSWRKLKRNEVRKLQDIDPERP